MRGRAFVGEGKGVLRWEVQESEGHIEPNEYAAFTAAELMELLPNEVQLHYKNGNARSSKHCLAFGRYWVGAGMKPFFVKYLDGKSSLNLEQREDTEAGARAKMLIYLLENKLLTL